MLPNYRLLSGLQVTVAGSTLRRALETLPYQKGRAVVEERGLLAADKIFTKKLTMEGAWSEADRDAVGLVLETAKALEDKLVGRVKGIIWVNESAARCFARLESRNQPADSQIRASELYRIEQLHCEMFAQDVPQGTEVAIVMDVTVSTAGMIIKDLVRWTECLMVEGSTCEAQRDQFVCIKIKV